MVHLTTPPHRIFKLVILNQLKNLCLKKKKKNLCLVVRKQSFGISNYMWNKQDVKFSQLCVMLA